MPLRSGARRLLHLHHSAGQLHIQRNTGGSLLNHRDQSAPSGWRSILSEPHVAARCVLHAGAQAHPGFLGSFQGVDAGIVASLERWGAVVHTQDPETTIGQPTCTFGRAAFVSSSAMLFSDVLTRTFERHGRLSTASYCHFPLPSSTCEGFSH